MGLRRHGMGKKRLFGDIVLKKTGQNRSLRHLKFDLPEEKFPFTATLMSSFSSLNLSDEEKSKLTQDHRKYLCHFNYIQEKDLKKAQRELVLALKKLQNDSLVIRANEFGAYVCLAAIFSGELPTGVDWRFELEEFALPLFPKNLVKNKHAGHLYEIALKYSSNGWVGPFPSLRKVPDFMDTLNDPDIHEFRRLDVA